MRTLNLGILAHVDAGKTTLSERLLYTAGAIDHVGSVDAGTTQTDSLELERERGITIRSAVASFLVGDLAVNLVDTPGHPDFIAEVERVLAVLDGAILVVSAVEGVQPQTPLLFRALRRLNVPTLIFVNKIDRAITQLVLMTALERAGTWVCEPLADVTLDVPSTTAPGVVAALAQLGGRVTGQFSANGLSTIGAVLPASRVRGLQHRLPGLSMGEGILETRPGGYQPIGTNPPHRPRSSPSPLDRDAWLASLAMRG